MVLVTVPTHHHSNCNYVPTLWLYRHHTFTIIWNSLITSVRALDQIFVVIEIKDNDYYSLAQPQINMSMGASFEDYSTLFYVKSAPVDPAGQAQSGYTIALLTVIGMYRSSIKTARHSHNQFAHRLLAHTQVAD